jgi:hypothetical protein
LKVFLVHLGIEIENPIHQGGVLCDIEGRIQALHACFIDYQAKKLTEFYKGFDISDVLPVLHGLQKGVVPNMYTLEAELSYVQIAQARVFGLGSPWVEVFESQSNRRNCVMVRRVTSGTFLLIIETECSEMLKTGDIILEVNGELCKSFQDVTKRIFDSTLDLRILRAGVEVQLSVPTSIMESSGTQRFIGWAGGIFQMPFKALYQLLAKVPVGVLCSNSPSGTPAQLYRLDPLDWIVAVNDEPVKDLDSFLKCIMAVPEGSFVRLKTESYNRTSKVVTVRTSAHYFGLWELCRDHSSDSGWKLKSF